MSDKKQIEEMAKYLYGFSIDTEADCQYVAKALYNAGYHKQSEGEWVLKWKSTFPQYEPSEYQCSICGSKRTVLYKYCPNCGAKMKG